MIVIRDGPLVFPLGENPLEDLNDKEFCTALDTWRKQPMFPVSKVAANVAIRFLNEVERRWRPK